MDEGSGYENVVNCQSRGGKCEEGRWELCLADMVMEGGGWGTMNEGGKWIPWLSVNHSTCITTTTCSSCETIEIVNN